MRRPTSRSSDLAPTDRCAPVVDRTEAGDSWAELARLEPLAAVLDSADQRGDKNRLIDRVHKAALDRALGDVKGKEVLDFGCGTGRLTEWLFSRGAVVHAVDVTPEMVDVARRRVPGAAIRAVDGATLPFPEERFDLVVTAYVIQYYVQRDAALIRELGRVIRPNGLLLAIEQVTNDDIGRGGTIVSYEEMFAAAGMSVVAARPIRLGDSTIGRLVIRHRWLSRLPAVPWLIEWEASRQRDVQLTSGRYADVLFGVIKGAPRRQEEKAVGFSST
jgi:ubiquinone/menaquinone biosynthesis C-methylase UbiE